MQLNCLPPKVTRIESQALFKAGMREFRHGKFMFETGFYVPFYLFKVAVKNGKTQTSNFLALDAVVGNLDLYSFEQELQDADFLLIESAQFPLRDSSHPVPPRWIRQLSRIGHGPPPFDSISS